MRPDLPWNVAGIPSEAREAARAAARREGLSIGEWLTRRILAGLSDMSEPQYHRDEYHRDEWSARPDDRGMASRRDSDEMLDRVSRSETESAGVYRRIEEQLRGMSRRLDSSERSQSESNRAMSKAAVEISISAREQAQAFDQIGSQVMGLSERLERVERQGGPESLRDAVKALHQGLSRLADQITETANQSAAQITALAGNIESVAGRLGQARRDAEASAQALEGHIGVLDERLRTVEKAAASGAPAEAVARLEEKLEARGSDPLIDRRLSGIERTLSEIVGRIERDDPEPETVEDGLKKLAQRLEAAEAANRDAIDELRKTVAEKPKQAAEPPAAFAGYGEFTGEQSAFSPPPLFDAPPFADAGLPPPPYEQGAGIEHHFAAGQGFGAEAFAPPPPTTVDSYLTAARRSARAAAEAERGTAALGGMGWNAAAARPAAKRSGNTVYIVIGILALVAIAVVAGAVLSHRSAGDSQSASTIGALFDKKAPPPQIKAVPAEPAVQAAPAAPVAAPPATNQQTQASPQDVAKRLQAHLAPAVPAPGSPRLVPQKIQTAAPPQQAAVKPAAPPMTAVDRLTQLANGGNAKAELVVGLKYLDGDGVAANDAQAAKWLGLAAAAGEPVAQYRLGTMFERGRGVAADAAKAMHWYEAAASQGNRKAMHNLAVAYAEGSGVKKDFSEAARWFSRAANLGLSDSQFNLAVLYERGLGVPQSLLDAYKWYAVAAAQGDAESKARIGAISAQMDPDGRAAAQHAADTFKPGPLDAHANVAPTLSDVTRGG